MNEETANTEAIQSTLALERSSISDDQRAYQSSVVDDLTAHYPVSSATPPYTNPHGLAKTRREADPWWELDLGRPQHLHSLSFRVSSGIQQRLLLYVMLLPAPLGFEDPFLARCIQVMVMSHRVFTYFDVCSLRVCDVVLQCKESQCVLEGIRQHRGGRVRGKRYQHDIDFIPQQAVFIILICCVDCVVS